MGFVVIALAFTTAMAFSTLPTPLYVLYQERDGYPTFLITVIFAAYALGVIASLLLFGHISDVFGRRAVIVVALLVELVAALMFIVWNDTIGLIAARIVTGLGVERMTPQGFDAVMERIPAAAEKLAAAGADAIELTGTSLTFYKGEAFNQQLREIVSKASGLAIVADKLGVDQADVLAIGDGRNDIEMLAWAGRGVAMGQSIEEVRAAADDVTDTVYDDGAATELSRWFPAP